MSMNKFYKLGFSKFSDTSSYRTGRMGEVHLDLYSNDKYMLFSRLIESDIRYLKEDGRFILFNNDGDTIMNILIAHVQDSMMKIYDELCKEIVFFVDNIQYRMVIYDNRTDEIMCA